MTLRLFEEPVEAAESAQQANVSLVERVFYAAWAAVVALIPAIATIYSAYQITNLFRNIRNAETDGATYILTHLHMYNQPLVIALVVAALLAFGVALALATSDKRRWASVGLPFSVGLPILAALPAVLLWWAETTTLDVITNKYIHTPPAVVAQQISMLLFSALALAMLMQGAIVLCAIVSLCIPARRRQEPTAPRRAFIWAVTAVLLLAFALAYYVLV